MPTLSSMYFMDESADDHRLYIGHMTSVICGSEG